MRFFFKQLIIKILFTMSLIPLNNSYHEQNFIKQTHQNKYIAINSWAIENLLTRLIPIEEQLNLEKLTFLSLVDLVKPGNQKCLKNYPPRSQNAFVIFRKDQQAKLTHENGSSFTSNIKEVSSFVSILWKNATYEQKTLYNRISHIAKQIHKHLWPNYSYKPNRHNNRQTIPFSRPKFLCSCSLFKFNTFPLFQDHQCNSLLLQTQSCSEYLKYSYYHNKNQSYSVATLLPYFNIMEINPSKTINDNYDRLLQNKFRCL